MTKSSDCFLCMSVVVLCFVFKHVCLLLIGAGFIFSQIDLFVCFMVTYVSYDVLVSSFSPRGLRSPKGLTGYERRTKFVSKSTVLSIAEGSL